MNYEIHLDPKIVALAAAGAATLGMTLNEALMRPIVTRKAARGNTSTTHPANGGNEKGGEA